MHKTTKFSIISLLFILVTLHLSPEPSEAFESYDWGRIASTTGYNEVVVVKSTNDGVVIAGAFYNETDFDGTAGEDTIAPVNEDWDAYLSKYYLDGSYAWTMTLTSTDEVWITDVESDSAGNIYILGYFSGSVDFDTSLNDSTLSSLNDSRDIFLAKYTSEGGYIDTLHIGGPDTEEAYRFAMTDEFIVLGGVFYDQIDLNIAGTSEIRFSSEGTDIFLAKYTLNGEYIDALTYGSSVADYIDEVTVDNEGNIIIGGIIDDETDLDGTDGEDIYVAINQDSYISKYSSDLGYLWSRTLTSSAYTSVQGLSVDNNGNIAFTSSFLGEVDLDGTGGVDLHSPPGSGSAVFITKYTADGDYMWSLVFGSDYFIYPAALIHDQDGNVMIAGGFENQLDFDPSDGEYILDTLGDSRPFISRYNIEGELVDVISFGDNQYEGIYSIDINSAQDLYITGAFYPYTNLNPFNEEDIVNVGGDDENIFLTKLTLILDEVPEEEEEEPPVEEETDEDGDGIDDAEEDLARNGDGNGDGTPDRLQSHVTTINNSINEGTVTIEVIGACAQLTDVQIVSESLLSAQDSNYNYPYGLLDFSAVCSTVGGTTNIKIYFSEEYDYTDWELRKFTENGIFQNAQGDVLFQNETINGVVVTTISYQIVDGGINDQDGVANGVIVDPIGAGIAIQQLSNTGLNQQIVSIFALLFILLLPRYAVHLIK